MTKVADFIKSGEWLHKLFKLSESSPSEFSLLLPSQTAAEKRFLEDFGEHSPHHRALNSL